MYFVNMLQDVTEGQVVLRSRSSASLVLRDLEETSSRHFTINKDGNIELGEGENIFAVGLSGEHDASYLPNHCKLTYGAVEDTEDNPIIVVLCNSIGLYRGVPAGIKFMYLGEFGILAALVYGACEFNGVALQRCNTTDLDNRKITKVLHGSDMKGLASFTDRESDYNYMYDVVAQVHMIEKEDKKGNVSFSCSYINSGEFWISKEGITKARELKAEEIVKRQQAEAERKAKLAAEKEETDKRRAERAAQEEAERKAKAEKQELAKEFNMKKSETPVSVGASAFLSAVAALQKN